MISAFLANILLIVDPQPDILVCPECETEHDPQFRHCLQCGARLPEPTESSVPRKEKAFGRASGIEPPEDIPYVEPYYGDGGAGEGSSEGKIADGILPIYAGTDVAEIPKEKSNGKKEPVPIKPASPFLVGLFIIIAFIVPPIGLLTVIVEAILPSYRKAALPTLIAAVIGAGLWGWIARFDVMKQMYNEPYVVLNEYVDAQDWARESLGHYLPLLELRIYGFLPQDFPPESKVEYDIIEHVLGPTGYVVEVNPGTEETMYYGMDSLWTDQTGDIRQDTLDGPRFIPK